MTRFGSLFVILAVALPCSARDNDGSPLPSSSEDGNSGGRFISGRASAPKASQRRGAPETVSAPKSSITPAVDLDH
ncbi:uncharacterized protein EV420DRAFT_1543392, partial [Desarmillaria tabescens]